MKIKVNDIEYQFPEIDSISYREATLVKKLTGLRLGEFSDAFEAGDTDMLIGLAAIAIYRDTGQRDLDYLLDYKLDDIQFVVEDSDTEADRPPDEPPATESDGSGHSETGTESAESGVHLSSVSTG